MARDQMQDVVLVEVTDLDGAEVAASAAPAGRADASREGAQAPRRALAARRLRRWWPVAAGLVLVLVVTSLVGAVRARERAARLAVVPGVLAPLDPGLAERWRAPLRGWGQIDTVAGSLVLAGRDGSGRTGVVALDPVTGRQRWSAPLDEVAETGDAWCVPLDGSAAAAPYVACRLVRSAVLRAQDGTYQWDGPALLVVLDARTGERVAERALPGEQVLLAAFGGGLVVTSLRADRVAQVTLEDPVTGDVTWSFAGDEPLPPSTTGPLALYPSVEGDVLVVNGPVTWAFDPDGELVAEWHLRGGDRAVAGGWRLEVTALPDGRFAVGESGGVGTGREEYGTVARADGSESIPIPGPVLLPQVDDGSMRGLLLTSSPSWSGIVALDASTGEKVWESDATLDGGVLVLDGRVILGGGRELRALDARSGAELWAVDAPTGTQASQVLTDGRVLVVPMTDPDLGPVLAALDPADGRTRWTTPLPADAYHLTVVDGRLVALTDRDLVALG
ncbi:PQQ-binding-like beta-propeller repeat protein [Cellulomonas fimi]|uniref:PQQ-binding-like beta-propeller repeat protein n=1 Tax=Cellulomonas fimi TaxID=1708 RepID=A0A7Y0QFQ6_CELFI|nr:PQQ-binding-like beta-propeller repeat protein [Cellulomonas fimi]NMR19306.1 PQQ-binding-like beta-propeller repeat protein [Cellulomonas fimi]